jgi:MFS family permease
MDIFHVTPVQPGFPSALNKASYLFTTYAFVQGISNLFFMPFINKYGRRPVYLGAFTVFFACAAWSAKAQSYGSLLASRIMLGFFSGSGDCLAPLTIADVTFLHERGLIMAIYSACLASGVALGVLLEGFIAQHHSWRILNWVGFGLAGLLIIAVFLTMPETAFNRNTEEGSGHGVVKGASTEESSVAVVEKGLAQDRHEDVSGSNAHHLHNSPSDPKESYTSTLKIFRGTYTDESLFRMFFRPFPLLWLPPVLWATLVQAATIGTFVAITSNYTTSYTEVYAFSSWQIGCCFLAVPIGAVFGILGGGWLSDWCANFLTKRNNGLREPEMRLPTIALSMVIMPVGCMLYAVGFSQKLHWIVPTIGLGCGESHYFIQGANHYC